MKLRAKRRPGNRAQTKAETARIDQVKRAGCLCCIARGFEPDDTGEPAAVEAHHLLSGGIRRGHMFTVGLCLWHHRGRLYVNGWDKAEHRLRLGPSLEDEPERFSRIFGDDEELLRMQAARL